MTEQEWLQATEPKPMLEILEGKVGKRKLRLFAVACCRRIPEAASYDPARKALEVAERYADGLAKWQELHEAGKAARKGARCTREGNRFAAAGASQASYSPAKTHLFLTCALPFGEEGGSPINAGTRCWCDGLERCRGDSP